MKTYAILKNENGSCIALLEIKNLTDKEVSKLKEQISENDELKKSKELELKLALNNADNSINELAREIRVLKGEE